MNAAACQYAGDCIAHSGGSLPFTGFDVWIIFAVAVALLLIATFLRYRSADHS